MSYRLPSISRWAIVVLLVAAMVAVLLPWTPLEAAGTARPVQACSVERGDGGASATISWVKTPNDGAARYVVERSRNGGTWYWAAKSDPQGSSVVNSGLRTNDAYAYRVRTKGFDGSKTDPVLCGAAGNPDPEPGGPVATSSCVATRSADRRSATISWVRAANDAASRFVVERSRNGGTWYWAAKAEAPALLVANTGLRAADDYDYRVVVKATDGTKTGATACSGQGEPEPVGLKAPISCTATREQFATSATIDWQVANPDGSVRYVIERSRNGGTWYWTGAVAPPAESFVRGGLVERDSYAFRVKAKGADNAFSEPTACTPVTTGVDAITLTVDVSATPVATVDGASTGMNLNWLLDSDIHRPRATSTADAVDALGVDVLRFPFGHLSDNYLWDVAPFGGTLEPRVASMHESPGLLSDPGRDWTWAVAPDGGFIDDMDFDEFVSIADETNSSTLVVVNAAAHKYQNGPSYADLRTTAVEWVQYAKDQGTVVDYWQIGNEADHPTDGVLTAAEYVALYRDFTAAMKAVDPSIKVGPGLIGSQAFAQTVMAQLDGDMDFAAAHQYGTQWNNHFEWARFEGDPNPNVTKLQNLVDASTNPNLPIFITETNSVGSTWDDGFAITTTKALAFFQMLMNQQEKPDVVTSFMWTTHSPWQGVNNAGAASNALFNTNANNPTPNGRMLEIFSSTTLSKLLPVSPSTGFVHSWTTTDPATRRVALHLLNKGGDEQPIVIDLQGGGAPLNAGTRKVFTGTTPNDPNPTWTQTPASTVNGSTVTTTLPPSSLVVIELQLA